MKYILHVLYAVFCLSCTSSGKKHEVKSKLQETKTIKNIIPVASHSFLNSCTHDKNNFRCVKYIKNHDGDTITVNIPHVHSLIGQSIKIRLKGINTAEINSKNSCEQDKAVQAKHLVAKKLQSAKTIHLLNISRGTFFRIVADVIADGQSLSKILLNEKLAHPYKKKSKTKMNWCTMSYLPQ